MIPVKLSGDDDSHSGGGRLSKLLSFRFDDGNPKSGLEAATAEQGTEYNFILNCLMFGI